MVAVITKYRCEHERCGREFPNETHALECEARHRAVEETYRLFFEEANKIVPAPTYESWPTDPVWPEFPCPVHICATAQGVYKWWRPIGPQERRSVLSVGGPPDGEMLTEASALDAACAAWLAACKIEGSNEFATTLPDGTVSVTRYR